MTTLPSHSLGEELTLTCYLLFLKTFSSNLTTNFQKYKISILITPSSSCFITISHQSITYLRPTSKIVSLIDQICSPMLYAIYQKCCALDFFFFCLLCLSLFEIKPHLPLLLMKM